MHPHRDTRYQALAYAIMLLSCSELLFSYTNVYIICYINRGTYTRDYKFILASYSSFGLDVNMHIFEQHLSVHSVRSQSSLGYFCQLAKVEMLNDINSGGMKIGFLLSECGALNDSL